MELSNITIEHMLENIFSNCSIKMKRRGIVEYYLEQLGSNGLFNDEESAEDVGKRVDMVLREDRRSMPPRLVYKNGYYNKARNVGRRVEPINAGVSGEKVSTNYTGKAGECAVMSELLFRGYNVNNMMVDEGVDIVASKANVFYYVQVKTRNVDERNRFHFPIKQVAFASFIGTQMRYILVARCMINNEEKNIYFTFTNNDIQRFLSIGVIPPITETISIKIEYDVVDGKFYMYNERRREDVTFYRDRFEL
jgi:hypothetical protein